MHGADPRAGFAQAVFFRGEQEALEILLHRILARRVAQEWFWPMVAAAPGAGEPASSAAMILYIVEKLRAQPASWVAVAAALFAGRNSTWSVCWRRFHWPRRKVGFAKWRDRGGSVSRRGAHSWTWRNWRFDRH